MKVLIPQLLAGWLSFLIFFPSVCAQHDAAVFWRASRDDGDRVSYILGTLPWKDQRLAALNDSVLPAFERCDAVAIQHVPTPDYEPQPVRMALPEGSATLATSLNPQTRLQWERHVRAQWNTGLSSWEQAAPVQLVLALVAARDTLPLPWSIDHYLYRRALAHTKRLIPAEATATQLAAYLNIPLATLTQALEGTPRQDSLIGQAVRAYQNGQIAALLHLPFADPRLAVLAHTDNASRNGAMAARLDSLFRQHKTFAALQLHHLPGPEGVLAQLETLGWQVEAVSAPASPERHRALLAAMYSDAGHAAYASSLPKVAMYYLDLSVQTDSTYAVGWFNRGMVRLGTGDPQAARTSFQFLTRLAPTDPDGPYGVGLAEQALGNVEAATRAFSHALAVAPHHDEARYQRALALMEVDQVAAAIEDLEACLPSDAVPRPMVWSALAAAHYAQGDAEQTVQYATLLIEQQPADTTARFYRARARYALQDLEGCIQDCHRALDAGMHQAAVWHYLGNAYEDLGFYPKALESFMRLTEQRPADAEAHSQLGRIYYSVERHSEAIQALNRAIDLDPESSGHYLNRAACLLAQGKDDAACSDLLRARQLGAEQTTALIGAHCPRQ
ncbi:MAG: TraB/GumN family protein [Bacteroidota bacterium]